jgi:hypothetical protein
MHYYNGVYFGNSFFKRWALVFSILVFTVILSLMLIGYESEFMPVVSLLADIFLISFGIMLLACYILCLMKGGNMPGERTIMHLHETSVSTWLSRLDTKCTCKKCHSKFRGYLPKYCPMCGSEHCYQKTTPVNEERYVSMGFFDNTRLFVLTIFVVCFGVYFCIFSRNDLELLTLFFIIFGSVYILLFGLAFLVVRYSEDKFDKPRFIEHRKCYGLHYMMFDTLPSFCPLCNYVLNIGDNLYCTKCGSHMSTVQQE